MSSITIKFNNKSYTEFVTELKDKVNGYFDNNHISTFANNEMKVKTLAMMACYGVPYILMLTVPMPNWAMLLMCVTMGVGIAGIGLAVQHDANHQAYSAKPWVNRVLGFTMSLIGGSDYMWRIKHNLFHHTYTNIYGKDEDISVASFLRLSPRDRHKPVHRIQHWIAIFAYSTLTLGWVMYFDYPKLFRYNGNGSPNPEVKHPWEEVLLLLGSKVFYYCYILLIPILVLDMPWWHVVVGFLIMHATSGLILTTVFQLAHVIEGTEFPVPEESGLIDSAWQVHQLKTTANFDIRNKWLTWYIGGLNFQVEHHLFPRICSIHYPQLSPIVKATAEKYGLPYHVSDTFGSALLSHFRMLKKLSLP